ncbi:hypothetical protein MNBD_PLANCTO03-2356, partial [hydrothermal vent metagenome]
MVEPDRAPRASGGTDETELCLSSDAPIPSL